MTPEFVAQRKKDLLKKKIALEEELKTFTDRKEGDSWETQYPKMNESEEDKVDEVEEYVNLLPIEHSMEENLKNINLALEKIEKGTYGKCENCGCECNIPEERLIAMPEAQTCNNCKECHCEDCKKEGE